MTMKLNHSFCLGVSSVALWLVMTTPAHAVFKCTDEKGVTHYGDTMPPQCAKKPIVELSGQGSVVRKIAAPLTAEQLQALEDDKAIKKQIAVKVAAQKLQDNAVLSTYGSERDFDATRDKEIKALDARRTTVTSRIGEVEKRLLKLNNEMEFYTAGKNKTSKASNPPPQLAQDQKRAATELETLQAEIAKMDGTKAEIVARFETQRTRWKLLKGGMPAGTLPEDSAVSAKPATDQASGGVRGMAKCADKVYECTPGVLFACKVAEAGKPKEVWCAEAKR